ncbi:MAG: hypothetical protein HY744_14700 [Deltaproteobacteria bacterium]|nr:hypothetical protein [Deltaproteobacteria bacterium]
MRRLAAQEGISFAETIRRCVDRALGEESIDRATGYQRAARVVGAFVDPAPDACPAREHDRALDEALR